jgi:glycosyltransferase involved in cell wall biosynthesis
VPAFNEERGVAGTIASCLSVDYPRELLEVIVVNDGSTDATWGRILEAKARWPELYVVDLGRNYGKCGAMAEGIRRARGEVLCFEDSDSYLEPGRPRDERWRPPGGRASTPARRVSTVREDTCWEVSVQVLMSQSTSGQRHRRLFHNRRAGRPKQARARTSTAMRS